MCSKVDCVLPYQEAALLAEAHKTATIELEEYVEDGTHLIAYVPSSLRNRLEKAALRFEAQAPQRGGASAATAAKRRKKPRVEEPVARADD